MTTDTNTTTDKTDTPDLSWIAEATKPEINYWAAAQLIRQILSMIPDSELIELAIETNANGVKIARSDSFDECGYGIGTTTEITANGEHPVPANYHAEAAVKAIFFESLHRAEVAHWANDAAMKRAAARAFIAERGHVVFGEDVIAGRLIHNIETDMFIAADAATDEERVEAAAAYARFLKARAEQ